MSDKPDLGNTRLNGFSEGLARGAKLTGRINRAISIGEEAMRQNGAAFDSHTRKNAGAQKHLDVCPKGCTESHKFCDWPACAKVGEHFASDHETPWSKGGAEKKNATYRLPSGWEVQPAADFKDADGKRPKWAKKAFYVLDGGTNPVGEGDTREAAIRDAYEKRLSGQDWGEKRNAESQETARDKIELERLTRELHRLEEESGHYVTLRDKPSEQSAEYKALMQKIKDLDKKIYGVRANAGDSDFRVVKEAPDDFAIYVGTRKVREGLHKDEVAAAMAEVKAERHNAGDRPAGVIYKSLDAIKKMIAECKEDLALYEKQGKDREARAMRADIKELEADYAHDAPLWEKHNAGDGVRPVKAQITTNHGEGALTRPWIIADSEGRRLYGPYPSYSAAEADFKRRNLEMANAGDDAFLGENWSGMDVDSGQAQEGLAPAEDVDVLANTREGVKRGARKYGSMKNSAEYFVSYRGGQFQGGTSRQLDDKVKALASQFGGEFTGSGGMIDEEGERDLVFQFKDASAWQKFLNAAKSMMGDRFLGSGKN